MNKGRPPGMRNSRSGYPVSCAAAIFIEKTPSSWSARRAAGRSTSRSRIRFVQLIRVSDVEPSDEHGVLRLRQAVFVPRRVLQRGAEHIGEDAFLSLEAPEVHLEVEPLVIGPIRRTHTDLHHWPCSTSGSDTTCTGNWESA